VNFNTGRRSAGEFELTDQQVLNFFLHSHAGHVPEQAVVDFFMGRYEASQAQAPSAPSNPVNTGSAEQDESSEEDKSPDYN
jgi:hypothetical protein